MSTTIEQAAARAGDGRDATERAARAMPAPALTLRAVVVVPARDEAARITDCLRSLSCQREVDRSAFELIVVLDGCSDATAERAREHAAATGGLALHAIELVRPVGVGRARRLGMDLACWRLLAVGRSDGLIASTDADTIVAEDWLAVQLGLIAQGAAAIGGHVGLHDAEARMLPAAALAERERVAQGRMRTARASSKPGVRCEHHHFSGASLAMTAATYRRCGGLPARAALEDEAMEQELLARGIPIERPLDVRVRTSARTDARAPRGLGRDLARTSWRARRSHHAVEFPLARLLAAKTGSVALVLPAREVAATVASIAGHARRLRDVGLLDEVLVVDARSRDGSARVAAGAGVEVVQQDELMPELGPARGKGDAMWRALAHVRSDIVAFADTDSEDFGEHFITGLLGPLLCDPSVQFVKGCFRRHFRTREGVLPDEGGRVTELMARPLLNLHAPELAVFDQPLAGETAGRSALLRALPFSQGYGVEIAMLIDVWRRVGLHAMSQVDLGARQNRHQPLRDLAPMAYAVLAAAQSRFLGADFAAAHGGDSMQLPPRDGSLGLESRPVVLAERPPLDTR